MFDDDIEKLVNILCEDPEARSRVINLCNESKTRIDARLAVVNDALRVCEQYKQQSATDSKQKDV